MNPVNRHSDRRSFRLLGGLVLALFAVYTAWLPIHMATVAHCVLPTDLCASANPPDHDHSHDHSHAEHTDHGHAHGNDHHHHPGHNSSDHHQPSPDEHGDQYSSKGASQTLLPFLIATETCILLPEESAGSVIASDRETSPQTRRAESPPPLRGPPFA